jgi:hypothetical protein
MSPKTAAWVRLQDAIKDGDKEGAEAVLAEDALRGRRRVAARTAIQRAFPEAQPETKSVTERQKAENEANSGTETAKAIANRNAGIKKRREARNKNFKPTRGPNSPVRSPEEEAAFRKPDPGGFNTPIFKPTPFYKE